MSFCGIDEPFTSDDWEALNSSTMTNFRKRIGPAGVQKIEQVVRDHLLAENRIAPKSQFVDTTAMEKDVAYPSDTNLLDKGSRRLLADSHLKQDHRMNRCRYKGFDGDKINVSMAVTVWNARKWMRQMTKERDESKRKK